jgi:hypothetical protein
VNAWSALKAMGDSDALYKTGRLQLSAASSGKNKKKIKKKKRIKTTASHPGR